jgi:uncharacterized coiled-coil protein SlyX
LDAQQRIAELEVIVAAKDAQIVVLKEQVATLMATVAALTKQVAELTEKLAQNSRNSQPPSSDPPGNAGNSVNPFRLDPCGFQGQWGVTS